MHWLWKLFDLYLISEAHRVEVGERTIQCLCLWKLACSSLEIYELLSGAGLIRRDTAKVRLPWIASVMASNRTPQDAKPSHVLVIGAEMVSYFYLTGYTFIKIFESLGI